MGSACDISRLLQLRHSTRDADRIEVEVETLRLVVYAFIDPMLMRSGSQRRANSFGVFYYAPLIAALHHS